MDNSEFEDRILDELQGVHPSEMDREKIQEIVDLTNEQIQQKQIEYEQTSDLTSAVAQVSNQSTTPVAVKVMKVIHQGLGVEPSLPSDQAVREMPKETAILLHAVHESCLSRLHQELEYLDYKKDFFRKAALEQEESTPIPEEGQNPQENPTEESQKQVQQELEKTEQETKDHTQELSGDEESSEGVEINQDSGDDSNDEIKITLEKQYIQSLVQAAQLAQQDSVACSIVRQCAFSAAKRKGVQLKEQVFSLEGVLQGKNIGIVNLVEQLLSQR